MQQDRSIHVLDHTQVFLEQPNVMAVDGADVPEAQIFKQHAAVKARFDPLFELGKKPLGRIT